MLKVTTLCSTWLLYEEIQCYWFVESSLDQPKSDAYVNVCAAQYVNFCERGAVRQSGVEGSECGGGGGSLAEEELRSPRKPLLHLTHAMLGVSLPS